MEVAYTMTTALLLVWMAVALDVAVYLSYKDMQESPHSFDHGLGYFLLVNTTLVNLGIIVLLLDIVGF